MAAHQAPQSLGFSRQEHWSGLPFLSPMHESEKRKWCCSVVSNSSQPHWLQPTRLLHPWDFPGRRTGVGAIAFSAIISGGLFLCGWFSKSWLCPQSKFYMFPTELSIFPSLILEILFRDLIWTWDNHIPLTIAYMLNAWLKNNQSKILSCIR